MTTTYDARNGATPLPPGRSVYPFANFPAWKRDQIAAAVIGAKPPRRWMDLGPAQIVSRAWYEWHWHRGVDPDKNRPRLSPALREKVIERDGLVCGLCGGPVAPDDVHIDHILPRSLGGRDRLSNLQVAHSRCNLRKGARI